MHRRYRQIARLIYLYCCVKYMKRVDGKWVKWIEKEKTEKENQKAEEKGCLVSQATAR